jgi:hypothetical protein
MNEQDIPKPTPAAFTPPDSAVPPKTARLWLRGLVVVLVAIAIGAIAGAAGLWLWQNQTNQTEAQQTKTTPTPSPTASTKINQSVLFYDTRGGISMADDNGQNVVRLVEDDYVGFAGVSSDKQTIYYTQLNQDAATVALYKYNLISKKKVALTSFEVPIFGTYETKGSTLGNFASVRPDGKYALLATKKGLALYDVAANTQKIELANVASSSSDCGFSVKADTSWLSWLIKPAQAALECVHYMSPRYAADGNRAYVFKGGYESGTPMVFDTMTGSIVKQWDYQTTITNSELNANIMVGIEDLGAGLKYFSTFNDPTGVYLTADTAEFGQAYFNGGSWSDNDQFFASLSKDSSANSFQWWVFDLKNNSHKMVPNSANTSTITSALWLKDNLNVLVTMPDKAYKVNSQTGTKSDWANEVLETITLLK